MGVDKHFTLYVKMEDEKSFDRFFAIYEKYFGDRIKLLKADNVMYELDEEFPAEVLKQEAKNGKDVEPKHYWDTSSGGHFCVFNRKDGGSVLQVSAYGRARYSYDELFSPYMRIARETGNACYQAYSESEDSPYDGKGFLEAAYDKPYHKITDREGIDRFLEGMGLARSGRSRESGKAAVENVSREAEGFPFLFTHHGFPQENGFAEALYNVKLDKMSEEPQAVQDLFRLVVEGREGPIADCRNEGYGWDSRTLCIASGAEEYLVSVTRHVDKDNTESYSATMHSCLEKKASAAFTKALDAVCRKHGVRMETMLYPKDMSMDMYNDTRQVLTAGTSRNDISIKDIVFAKEKGTKKDRGAVFFRPGIRMEKESDSFVLHCKDGDGQAMAVRFPAYREDADGKFLSGCKRLETGKFAGWHVVEMAAGKDVPSNPQVGFHAIIETDLGQMRTMVRPDEVRALANRLNREQELSHSKSPGKVFAYLRPGTFTYVKENGQAVGISVNGYKDPEGKYYAVKIPFHGERVQVNVVKKEGPAKGGVYVNMDNNAVLDMVSKEGEATLDAYAFKRFAENKNRKAERAADDKRLGL